MRAAPQRAAQSPAAPAARLPIQMKTRLGPVDDPLEREADRIADAIVADLPVTGFSAAPPRPQLNCAECAEEDEEALQRKETGPAPGEAPPIVYRVLRQPGRPLDAAERAYFEPRFGTDFGWVRLHRGEDAARSARAVAAKAYAFGQHIVLGDRASAGLQQTLSHELAHVVQQGAGGAHGPPMGRVHESEAVAAASALAGGKGPFAIKQRAAPSLARQPLEGEETEVERRRREAIASLDWMAGIPPIVFDDDAPALIIWAEAKTQQYYDPEASDEKRRAIAEGMLKVQKQLMQFEGRARRDSDGALLYTNRLTEISAPWTKSRVRSLEDIPLFSPESMAEWRYAAAPPKRGAGARSKHGPKEPPKRRRAELAPAPQSSGAVNITFHKQPGMTMKTEEGQRRIIAFIVASTRTGYTGDQLSWVVAQLGLEKRWAPPPDMDLGAWQESFDAIPEGGEVTLTITKSFSFEIDRLLLDVPSNRDFLLEGYRIGVLESEAGLKLGIATFAVGSAALGGGMLLGTMLAPGGAVGAGGLLGGGVGQSMRALGTHLYLNAPSLYGQTMLYGGAMLSGAALGQHVLEIRQRGLGLADIPQFAGDLMPLASGYADYLSFGGGWRGNRPPSGEPDTEGGPPRPPTETAEPDLVITRPAMLDPQSGKVKASIVDLGAKRTFDGEIDPQTGNGQIVDRRTREVVGVIANGEIRKPSSALPAAGATTPPPTPASPATPSPVIAPPRVEPDLGLPTFGNLPGRVPVGDQRVELRQINGRWFEIEPGTTNARPASGEYSFVVQDGRTWASRYGHAEAAMGGRVSYAGQVNFDEGVQGVWSNASGTYRPAGAFAGQAGFQGQPQLVPPHAGKQVQLPVFQPHPDEVLVPPSGTVGPAGQAGNALPHWMDLLPAARRMIEASRAKYDIPPGVLGMATPGPPPAPPQFSFATDEAWIYDGLRIRVVNTPTGVRSFYQRDGRGGIEPYGAQIGDWAPHLGFRPLRYGAQLIKPPSAVSPNTPPDLYRWGNQEAYEAHLWVQAQPEPQWQEVGAEDWGIIQRRLEELGVFVGMPLGNVPDVD
jgi:hypothetical protein